jgi:hypothetical protein
MFAPCLDGPIERHDDNVEDIGTRLGSIGTSLATNAAKPKGAINRSPSVLLDHEAFLAGAKFVRARDGYARTRSVMRLPSPSSA